MGNEYVWQILAGGNVETLNRYAMGERTIVTAWVLTIPASALVAGLTWKLFAFLRG